jgi:signal transduction histidine kinase/ActR/RegA family two-component response regulator
MRAGRLGRLMTATSALQWSALPRPARSYVAVIIGAGMVATAVSLPTAMPDPSLFAVVLVAVCVTSAWKLNLPIALASGATLSVSYAADMMALLLLGPKPAVLIAAIGVWIQCTVNVKQPYPLYRTVFSTAAEAITMAATGAVYVVLGGVSAPAHLVSLTRPVAAAIGTYFCVNTGLVAGAIALSTNRSAWRVWRDDFAWSAASFIVAGSAGAVSAVVIRRGWHWEAVLLLAPVYLTYRTYRVFVARLEEQQRALAETQRLEQIRTELLAREQSARASAETANRLKDQFLATVSHELRTPLNAILGWAEMLKNGTLDGSRRDRAHEAILNNAKRQARLIEELLDVSRIMSGKLRIDRGVVDPRDIIAGALETVQPEADAKGIRIAVQIEPDAGALRGDGPRLQQVLWNLLSNAVKFTPSEGTVSLRFRRSGNAGELVVEDTGCGISADFLKSAFEPFRQADGSPTRIHGGLGLGLAIVKHLVEAHGGSVSVQSAGSDQGSTFTVRLPLANVRERRRVVVEGETDDSRDPISLAGLRVLVVDDDADSRCVVAARLEHHEATVMTAGSAEEAMTILGRERVDVLLADIGMPGEDGYSLVRRLRSTCQPPVSLIPAAALTAFAREEDRQAALRAGFQTHLSKPVEAASLVSAVAALGRVSVTGV